MSVGTLHSDLIRQRSRWESAIVFVVVVMIYTHSHDIIISADDVRRWTLRAAEDVYLEKKSKVSLFQCSLGLSHKSTYSTLTHAT